MNSATVSSLLASTTTALINKHITKDAPTHDMSSSSIPSDVTQVSSSVTGSDEKVTSYLRTTTSSEDVSVFNVSSETDGMGVSVEDFLQRKNDEFTMLVLPAIVFLGVLFILGVSGNAMVLYVYNQKLQRGTIRWFVQALAVFDLLSCLVAIPGEIVDMRNNYTFGSSPMCKVLRTVSMFCTMASGMILMVVAVERYKRICTPLNKQITPRLSQVIIILCTIAASVCAAPASILYGHQSTTTDNPAINGSDCSTADTFIGTVFPLVFSSFQFLLFTAGALALVVLYSLIGRKVCSHERFRRIAFGVGPAAHRRMSLMLSGSECSSPTTDDAVVFAFPAKKNGAEGEKTKRNLSGSTTCTEVQSENNNVKFEEAEGPEEEEEEGGSPKTAPFKNGGTKLEFEDAEGKPDDDDQSDEGKPLPNAVKKGEKRTRLSPLSINGPSPKQGSSAPSVEPPSPTTINSDFSKSFDTFRKAKPGSRTSGRERHRSGESFSSHVKGRYQRRSTQHTQSDIRRFLHRSDSVNSGTRRTTLMLFLITVVYLLSFLPYLVLNILKVLDEDSLSGRGGAWEVIHNVLLRSYFINSMANPIIYSFCSRTFSAECSKVLHCRCCRSPLFVY